jgi:hypothetical protein
MLLVVQPDDGYEFFAALQPIVTISFLQPQRSLP